MKAISPKRAAMACGLDVGTSKIVCVIARLTPRAPQEALRRRSHAAEGLGSGPSTGAGMKAGTVVDSVEAEQAIREAVDSAERMAKAHVEAVVVSVSAGRIGSELYAAGSDIRGHCASDADIERVLAA